jgi:hypothetical protein
VTDLEVAIGFRWETRLHAAIVLTGGHIGGHHLADEVGWSFWSVVGHSDLDKRSASSCASQKMGAIFRFLEV